MRWVSSGGTGMETLIYGEVVRQWKGVGRLELDGEDVPCSFELVQVGTGRIIISSQFEGWMPFSSGTGRLVGRASNNGSGDIMVNRVRIRKQVTGSEVPLRTRLVVLGSEYEVKAREGTPVAFEYGLTNVLPNTQTRPLRNT